MASTPNTLVPAIQSPSNRRLCEISASDSQRAYAPFQDLRVGARSILNSAEPDPTSNSSPCASAVTADSPRNVASSFAQHRLLNLQLASDLSAGYAQPHPHQGILTTRSPSLSSSAKESRAIDAQQSPFLHDRGGCHTGEASRPAESISSHSRQTRQQHGLSPATTQIEHTWSLDGSRPDPGHTPQSGKVGPSSSQSISCPTSLLAYSCPKTFSEPLHLSGSYFPGSFVQQEGICSVSTALEGPHNTSTLAVSPPSLPATSLPASGAGNGSRQASGWKDPMPMVTISTSQGLIHVPVDTYQASRVFDKKRARNACASARFRQRRRDKVEENIARIGKLQTQTQDLEKRLRKTEFERDFYQNERDRFRDVVIRNLVARDPTSGLSQNFQTTERTGGCMPKRQRTNTLGGFQAVLHNFPLGSTTLAPIPSPPAQVGKFPPEPAGSLNLPPLRIGNTTSLALALASTVVSID